MFSICSNISPKREILRNDGFDADLTAGRIGRKASFVAEWRRDVGAWT
jgi:hypothetical protein